MRRFDERWVVVDRTNEFICSFIFSSFLSTLFIVTRFIGTPLYDQDTTIYYALFFPIDP